MTKKLAIVIALLFSATLAAQAPKETGPRNAKISGRVIDATTGDPMLGVAVVIKELQMFAQTDFEGRYSMDVPAGEHEVTYQIATYEPQVVRITAVANQVTARNITLGVKTAQEVVVQGRALNNTEASMLNLQRKSGAVSDGVSQEAIKKSPDSSASDVLRRVTGITIVDGKYVFVRGLGERYSNTILNDAVVASPEPDKRVVPLDVFPAGLIKNIRIIKSFLPENPGEFSGGLVAIETQEFPDEFLGSFGLGLGANANTTTRRFMTYNGGKRDWMGKDDGTRALPETVRKFPDYVPFVRGSIFGGIPPGLVKVGGAQMPETADTRRVNAGWDRDVKGAVGDSMQVGTRGKFGYLVGTSYNRKWRYRQSKENSYVTFNPLNETFKDTAALIPLIVSDAKKWTETVLWGNNLNLSFEPIPNQRIFSKTLYSRNSDKYVRESEGRVTSAAGASETDIKTVNTGWIGREIMHQVLGGAHALRFSDNSLPHKLEWYYSFSRALRDEPNLTQDVYERQGGAPTYRDRNGGPSTGLRFFSYTKDDSESLAFNYEIPFTQWSGLQSKFKLGALATDRTRQLKNRAFNYVVQTGALAPLESEFSPQSIAFSPASLFQDAYRFEEQTGSPNRYDAEQKLHAYYGQLDMPLVPKFRFVGGARYEDSFQTVKTYEAALPLGQEYLPSSQAFGRLHTKDLLPSANLVWEVNPDMNLRLGYTETVNRPDFRDLSPVGFATTFGGERVFGNRGLARAYLHNYDTRWEWYITSEDYVAVGGFFKDISNPIEKIGLASVSTNRDYTFINGREGEIRGAEFEVRKFFAKRFGIETNFFLIRSRVQVMSWEDQALIRLGFVDRVFSQRAIYSPTSLERPLEGQSPYVVNAKMAYYFDDNRTGSIGLLYNFFSDRIDAAGSSGAPDQIEKGAGVLDLVFEKKIGDRFDIKAAAKNILDTRFKVVQTNPFFASREELVRSYRDGVSYSFSMNYKL